MSARVKDHPGYEVPSAKTVSQGPQWDEYRTNPKLEVIDGPEVAGRPTVKFRLPSMTNCEWFVDEVAGVLEDMMRRHREPEPKVIPPKAAPTRPRRMSDDRRDALQPERPKHGESCGICGTHTGTHWPDCRWH